MIERAEQNMSSLELESRSEAHNEVAISKTVKVVFEVTSTNEFAQGPEVAVVVFNQELVNRIAELSDHVVKNRFSSTSIEFDVEWAEDTKYLMRGDQLEVTGSAFFFTAHPKHSSNQFETRVCYIDDFLEQFAEAQDGETITVPKEDKDWYLELYVEHFCEEVEDLNPA